MDELPVEIGACARTGQLLALLQLLLILLCLSAQPARAEPRPANHAAEVSVGEPEGFGNLVGPQEALVDVYFGGVRQGDAIITYRPGTLALKDPASLAALLPDLADEGAVRDALSDPELPTHANLVCAAGSNPTTCGRLDPPIAGIIFNQDRFRVDVFVNPRLLSIKLSAKQKYLPLPDEGLSVLDAVGGVLSGSDHGHAIYNLQNRLLIGDANKRLEAALAYSSGFGIQTDRLIVAADLKNWRYSAGAFWAPGTDLIGRRQILGVGAETQIDTRLDKDQIRGSPLIAFLGQRSRVDVLRDGKVLSSRIYDAGNQSIETADLPEGSYEIVLSIEEAGGARRAERRFFSKNPRIAAKGQKILFAYAGLLTDNARSGFLSVTGIPFFQAGTARRVSTRFEFDATVLATNHAGLGQIGAYYIGPVALARVAAAGSTEGTYGGLIQVSSQTGSRFNFNFDLRHMHVGKALGSLATFQSVEPLRPIGFGLSALPLARSSYAQISGTLSYSLPGAQVGLSASWRRENDHRLSYSIEPSFRWELYGKGQLRMSLNGDVAVTDRGKSGFLGVSLQLLGRHSALISSAGVRSSSLTDEPKGTGLVGALAGSWQGENIAGGDLSLGGVYQRDLDREAISASASLRAEKASINADVIQGLGRRSGSTQYSFGFQTLVAAKHGSVAIDGRSQSDSMILVKLDGAQTDNSFEVLVNDGPVGIVRFSKPLAVALPPYKQYDVRIRSSGSDLVNYDTSVRKVSLYPGNVVKLQWSATRVIAIFGRLVFDDGNPVSAASITTTSGISETDDRGYFEIQTGESAELDVKTPDGRSCRVRLPVIQQTNGYAQLGTIICRTNRAVVLSSADNSASAR